MGQGRICRSCKLTQDVLAYRTGLGKLHRILGRRKELKHVGLANQAVLADLAGRLPQKERRMSIIWPAKVS
jgi:hypothetical protein